MKWTWSGIFYCVPVYCSKLQICWNWNWWNNCIYICCGFCLYNDYLSVVYTLQFRLHCARASIFLCSFFLVRFRIVFFSSLISSFRLPLLLLIIIYFLDFRAFISSISKDGFQRLALVSVFLHRKYEQKTT